MQVRKQQVEPDMEQLTSSKLGKEYVKAVYCHPAYLIYIQSTSCKMPVWMKHKLESRLPGEKSTTSDMKMIMAESEEELKSLLMRVREETKKAGLKLNIQKTEIMSSGPKTSQQADGEKVKAITDFIFLGSEITVDVDFSYEIKRHLLFGRKAKTNLDSIFKSRDFTLPTKVHLVKPMIFPAVMYGCESWTTKKAEH